LIRVAFIGGLTNGRVVFDYLRRNKFVNLVMTITYPDSYLSPRSHPFPEGESVFKTLDANSFAEKLDRCALDYIFVAGWSQLIGQKILESPSGGVIGFHPSRLPMDRGRSVLAWQIEAGSKESGVSMFYYDTLPDAGDIIAFEPFSIAKDDYINDVLDKVDLATLNLMRAYFPLIRVRQAPRRPQSIQEGNFRRLRTDYDSLINWNRDKTEVFNKIRAISRPYPGAIAELDHKKYRVYRAEVLEDFPFSQGLKPGSIAGKMHDGTIIVSSRNGFLRILEYELIE